MKFRILSIIRQGNFKEKMWNLKLKVPKAMNALTLAKDGKTKAFFLNF